MARVNDIRYRGLAQKFGRSSNDYTQASTNVFQQVLLDWSNQSIEIMRQELMRKSKSKSQATAESFRPVITPISGGMNLKIQTDVEHVDYIDKGVKGLKGNKAPNSPYAFKNLGTPPKMIDSFKKWIANAGIKSFKTNAGKKKSLYKINRKTKTKSFRTEKLDEAAQSLALATKIGGIKPKNFIKKAINRKRIKELSNGIGAALGETIKIQVLNYGNNNK